jgi:hypothetical protein
MQGVGAVLVDQVGQVVADPPLRLLVLLRELLAPEEVVAELLVRLNWAVLAALVWLYWLYPQLFIQVQLRAQL